MDYSILHSSTIEGIGVFAKKFSILFEKFSLRKYDPLDHRKPFFDQDYEQFKQDVVTTEIELRSFFAKIVSMELNVAAALRSIARYR